MEKSIHTHRDEVIEAYDYIIAHRAACYLGSSKNQDSNYYNVNGIVWEWFHEGLGSYPTTKGIERVNFTL